MRERTVKPFADMMERAENTFYLREFPNGQIVLMNTNDEPVPYEQLIEFSQFVNECVESATPEAIELYTKHAKREKQISRNAQEKSPQEPTGKRGFVYVLRMETDIYKIGRTANLKSRLANYRTHSTNDIEMICFFEVIDMIALEMQIHNHFKDQRIDDRERFRLDNTDIEFIKQFPDYLALQGVDLRL